MRTDGETKVVFLMNFNRAAVNVPVLGRYYDLLGEKDVGDRIVLEKYAIRILRETN